MTKPSPVPLWVSRPLLGLLEVLEQLSHFLRRNSRTGVFHFHSQPQLPGFGLAYRGAHPDVALLGEFHRIAQQVDQHLARLAFIRDDVAWQVLRLGDTEPESLFHRGQAEHGRQIVQQGVQVEFGRLQPHPAGLDLRHLEHVVDQGQQMLTAAIDDAETLPGSRTEGCIPEHQLGIAENGVQRSADLMRHARQKDALGLVGRVRRVPGARQLFSRSLDLGDVLLDG